MLLASACHDLFFPVENCIVLVLHLQSSPSEEYHSAKNAIEFCTQQWQIHNGKIKIFSCDDGEEAAAFEHVEEDHNVLVTNKKHFACNLCNIKVILVIELQQSL